MGDSAEEFEHVLEGLGIILWRTLGVMGMVTVDGVTYIHRIDVSFMEGVHVTVRQQTVWEQRQKDKLWKCEQLISGERKASPSAVLELIKFKYYHDESIPQVQCDMLIRTDI